MTRLGVGHVVHYIMRTDPPVGTSNPLHCNAHGCRKGACLVSLAIVGGKHLQVMNPVVVATPLTIV